MVDFDKLRKDRQARHVKMLDTCIRLSGCTCYIVADLQKWFQEPIMHWLNIGVTQEQIDEAMDIVVIDSSNLLLSLDKITISAVEDILI